MSSGAERVGTALGCLAVPVLLIVAVVTVTMASDAAVEAPPAMAQTSPDPATIAAAAAKAKHAAEVERIQAASDLFAIRATAPMTIEEAEVLKQREAAALARYEAAYEKIEGPGWREKMEADRRQLAYDAGYTATRKIDAPRPDAD